MLRIAFVVQPYSPEFIEDRVSRQLKPRQAVRVGLYHVHMILTWASSVYAGPLPPHYIVGWPNITSINIKQSADRTSAGLDNKRCGAVSSIPKDWARPSRLQHFDLR
jgi:hypothetical protein